MDKSIDIVIMETRQSLFKAMVDSKLPLSILSLILGDIKNDLDKQLINSIAKETEKKQGEPE